MSRFQQYQATYACMAAESSLGSFRTLEAHAATWQKAHQALPRWIYPEGRRYRRVSGPVITQESKS